MEEQGQSTTASLMKILMMVILLAMVVGGGVSHQQQGAMEGAVMIGAGRDASGGSDEGEEILFAQGEELLEVTAPLLETGDDLEGETLLALETESPGEEPEVEEEEEEEEKPLFVHHLVQSGETLWDIAQLYGTDVNSIAASNNLVNANRLSIGDQLIVPTGIGVVHHVDRGETLSDIATMYNLAWTTIRDVNSIENPNRLTVGQPLFIPGAREHAHRYQLVRNGVLQRAFRWPARGRISSRFGPRWGRMHYGLDLAVPTGTPIEAAADGRVTFSGWRGGYGYLVTIDHGNGVETRYAHNSRLLVRAGERVKRGQVIARSGNTGNSTGPHLHFEIRYRGTAVDPLKYLLR
ncbi:MAG: peptidoglycan DD-metalloendopeptidase family protein [Limnochordia bacterium]|jgi:murein DD-endopeptidase MepM/ murein hydrolase activator NlpD